MSDAVFHLKPRKSETRNKQVDGAAEEKNKYINFRGEGEHLIGSMERDMAQKIVRYPTKENRMKIELYSVVSTLSKRGMRYRLNNLYSN